ncbi:MAG: hypothetical protein ABJA10_08455 [Aestuariivirga sp.]
MTYTLAGDVILAVPSPPPQPPPPKPPVVVVKAAPVSYSNGGVIMPVPCHPYVGNWTNPPTETCIILY